MSQRRKKQNSQTEDEAEKERNTDKNLLEKHGKLREKEFVARESVLTEMYKIPHIRSLYNIFLVVMIIQFLHAFFLGFVSDTFDFGIEFILWNFGKPLLGLKVWLSMLGATFGVYGFYRIWAQRTNIFPPSSPMLRYWDYAWLSILVVYQISFLVVPAMLLLEWWLPPATAITVLCEQVRMVMKSHAFVRSNVPRVLDNKHNTENKMAVSNNSANKMAVPSFSQFVYFLFCPTLIYRDSYPRTKEIRWRIVAKHLMEVVGVVFYHCCILQRWIQPAYREWGLVSRTPQETVELIFDTMLPAILADVTGIYCFLHAWSNAAAELLRFADRMFYQDWWTATSYSVYFRKWNGIIHDWLYMYIYRDLVLTLKTRSKFIPTMAVFLISAAVHEYIFAFAFGFFYPLLFFMFIGVGASLVFVPSESMPGGNTFFLLVLLTGTGLFTSLYTMEIYARVNCHKTQSDWLDFVTPRSWNCIPVTTELPS